jgi:hypothetical protein
MSRLSAFAAVGLADLVELGVGNGVELGNLAGFGVLLVALRNTCTEAWELSELAWALNVEFWEGEAAQWELAYMIIRRSELLNCGDLSEVLDVLLAKAVLEALRGSSDDTSEESNEEEFHFDCLDVFV